MGYKRGLTAFYMTYLPRAGPNIALVARIVRFGRPRFQPCVLPHHSPYPPGLYPLLLSSIEYCSLT